MSFAYFLLGCLFGAIGMGGVAMLALAEFARRMERLHCLREMRNSRRRYDAQVNLATINREMLHR